MGGLVKMIFGGDDSKDEYNKALEEQEHRKQMEEEKARAEATERARQTALTEAEAKKRKDAFLATTDTDDEEKLGKKNILG